MSCITDVFKLVLFLQMMFHSAELTQPKPPTSQKNSSNVVNDELIKKRRVGIFWN